MKSTEFSDEKIGTWVDQRVSEATSWYSSKLSRERANVLDYIERKLPRPYHPNGSRWVNPACFTALQYMQAMLGDTFSAGSGIVRFDARHAEDVEAAEVASAYANHVFYDQNNGERLIRGAIFDGLTARVGIAKIWWDKGEGDDEVEQEFDNLDDIELQQWMADKENILHIEAGTYEDGTHFGKIVKRVNRAQVRIEIVNPEEFAIERHAKELSDKYFCVHRTVKTIAWICANYPAMEKEKDKLRSGIADDVHSLEVLARFELVSDGLRIHDEDEGDETEVTVSEAYCRLRRKGDLTPRLYKVLRCGTVTIDIEAVEELPFVCFTPIPYEHRFYGENYIRTVMPTQDILTAAQRSIIDHTMITNNPRYLVMNGTLANPEELLDNRLAGIVNVNHMEGIAPLTPPALNPMLFSLIQGMEELSESITGISAASIGQNKDAISKQNSAALFEKITGMSQIRQKEIARQFATQFLCPLFEKINRLVVQFEKNDRIIDVAGNFVPVNPSTWFEGRAARAAAHLGYGEREAKARQRMDFGAQMKEHGGEVFMGTDGFYNLISDAMTDVGERANIKRYMPITPDKIQPPAPSPLEQADVKVKEATAFKLQAEAEATIQKVKQHSELSLIKQQLNEYEARMNDYFRMRDADRKDADTKNRILTEQAELALLMNPPEGTESRGIISP